MSTTTTGYRSPPMVPSVVVVAGAKRWWEHVRMGGLRTIGVHLGFGAIVLLNAGGWLLRLTLLPLFLLILVVGLLRVRRVSKGREPGLGYFDSAYKLFLLTVFGLVFTSIMRTLDNGWASLVGAIVGFLILEFLATPAAGSPMSKAWWSHERMAGALLSAKILTSPGRDMEGNELLPTLHFRGRPTPLENGGIEVTYDLPEGATWQSAVGKHEALASAMRLPVQRLHLGHDEDDPECALTVTVLPTMSRTMTPVEWPETTIWPEGVVIGPDRLAQPVTMRTVGAHALIVGMTGSGKTCLGRYGSSFALLDPEAYVVIIDGKDDLDDWRPLQPLAEAFIGGATHDTAKEVSKLLARLDALSDARGELGRGQRPVLVIIDEWMRIRSAAKRHDAGLAKQLDAQLIELAATCRSRNISLWLFAQRGTEGFIPPDLKANMTLRIVGQTYETAEARYVLDKTPEWLPGQFGQFLFGSDRTNVQLALVPKFDDDDFKAVVKQATKLRREYPLPPLFPADLPPAEVDTSVQVITTAPAATFEQAVVGILREGPLLPKELYAELPDRLRPASVIAMGKLLRKMQDSGGLVRPSIGKDKGWALPGNIIRSTPRTAPVDPPPAGSSGESDRSIHAQNDPSDHNPSHTPEHEMALP